MSSVGCKAGEINVYDSLYSDLDEVTKCKVQRVLGSSTGITFNFPNVQRQVGLTDCGLFAVAFATSLVLGQDVLSFNKTNCDLI